MSSPEPDSVRAALRAQVAFEAWADAAAGSLGLNRTDFAAVRAVLLEGPCTAGRLGDVTGLSSGAITGTLDRLEKAGYVRRESDPDDRRKVVVLVADGHRAKVESLLAAWAAAPAEVRALKALSHRLAAETAQLNADAGQLPEADASGAVSFQLAGRASATLEIAGGALDLTVDGAAGWDELARADFGRGPVKAVARDGLIRISHRGRWGGGRPSGRVSLNDGLEWAIRIGGGSNRITFSLADVKVSGVEIEGGDGHLRFALGAPKGELAVRVNGGASHLSFVRPPATQAELVIRGGFTPVVVDGNDLGRVYTLRWISQSGSANSRVRVGVRGGANHIELSTSD